MDVALCVADNTQYAATVFAQLPGNDLAEKRTALICPSCQAQAYFRKAARNGQAACFGARPHMPGCPWTAADGVHGDGNGDGEQDALFNPGQRIIVDFNYGAVAAPDAPQNEEHENPEARGRYLGQGPRPNADMHRRLSTLLRNLVHTDQFRGSDQTLVIEGQGEFVVRDFFIRLSDVTGAHQRQFKGFWGMVPTAAIRDGALWLNSGGPLDMSFCIPESQRAAFAQRFHILDEIEDPSGALILAFGTMHVSQGGKKYVRLEDINQYYIDLV